ncbi:hypothetical protein JHK84_044295 [Glycine max]|nr:hypothetical protein JHK84_044295 [Glycine max]
MVDSGQESVGGLGRVRRRRVWVWELCGAMEVAEMQKKRVKKEERKGYFSFSSIFWRE